MDDLEFYKIIRSQIEHEDGLIGQRISWFITSQSFLFSAFAIVVNGFFAGAVASHATRDLRTLLIFVLPLIGGLSSVLIEMTLVVGFAAMWQLRKFDREHGRPIVRLPAIQGAKINYRIGAAGPLLLPILFFTVWMLLLIVAARTVR